MLDWSAPNTAIERAAEPEAVPPDFGPHWRAVALLETALELPANTATLSAFNNRLEGIAEGLCDAVREANRDIGAVQDEIDTEDYLPGSPAHAQLETFKQCCAWLETVAVWIKAVHTHIFPSTAAFVRAAVPDADDDVVGDVDINKEVEPPKDLTVDQMRSLIADYAEHLFSV